MKKRALRVIIVFIILFTMIFQNMSLLVAATIPEENNQLIQSQQTEDSASKEPKEEQVEDNASNDDVDNNENTGNTIDDNTKNTNVENKITEEDVIKKQDIEVDKNISTFNSENKGRTTNISKNGKLFINIDLRLPQQNPNLKVTLKKVESNKNEAEPTFSKGEGNELKLYYTFNDLEPGKYTLTISGQGYKTFSQTDIEIKENTTSELSYTNGYDISNLTNSEGKSITGKYGIIPIGDVNSDLIINKDDETALVERIEENDNKSDYTYDINGDGVVDIVDLSYVSINKEKSFIGAVPSFIANVVPENTKFESDKDTKIILEKNSKVEDILRNNENYLTLQPNSGNEISEEHPVQISLGLEEQTVPTEIITISPSLNPENNIESGYLVVNGLIDGEEKEILCTIKKNDKKNDNKNDETTPISNNLYRNTNKITYSLANMVKVANDTTLEGKVTFNADGTIVVDLGNKVAIKKITIRVTGTKSNKLADIAKVEFLNGMSDKIPEPELNIPDGVDVKSTEENITVSWNYVPNVTGYEVSITANGITENLPVDGHILTIENFNGKSIKDQLKTEYEIKVKSVNGEWSSGYSSPVYVTPTANSVPNKPTGVNVVGSYKEIKVYWDLDSRADSYEVWYREYESTEFKLAASGLTNSYYQISNLKEKTKYQAYVIAVNKHGKSMQSIIGTAETTSVQPVTMPQRKLINTPVLQGKEGENKLTNHIVNVTLNKDGNKRFMVDSILDTDGNTAKGIVDNSYVSFFQVNDWDLGGWYTGEKSPTVEFDKEYTMNYFTVAQAEWTGSINYASIVYYDSNNKSHLVRASQVYTRQDKDGNNYTVIKIPEPITTKKISVNVGRGDTGNRKITIAEICFYEYDNLEDRINALYEDQMHVKLKSNVKMETIEALEAEVNKVDEASGEYHPERDKLQIEINTAKEIYLNGEKLCNTVKIDTNVTNFYDTHIEFKNSGMNAWQPLGVVAHAGDTVTIYVGNEYKSIGDSTNLQLIATQYHGYASNWTTTLVKNLQVGKNVVTIPNMLNMDVEKGGSLYINYTGLKDDHPLKSFENSYGVRVEGGYKIPVLDLTKVEKTEKAKKLAITEYIKELENLMTTIAQKHNEICTVAGKSYGEKEYGQVTSENNETNCILGATEIVLDHIMYSVSAKQILEGLNKNTTKERVEQLYNSIEAMDDMIDLFYANKGLSELPDAGSKNKYPLSRLNIRYMRMTGRAFMYAGGAHIGIEWPEVKLLSQGDQIKTDANGKYESGNYFGWGIAHEIGHVINQQAYVHGEVTNNYFSILSQAKDTNDSVRFNYSDVYKKVTSAKVGKSQNVFTQLGLYWQLHLAYDKNGYNFKKYSTYKEVLDSYVFARMDTYARDTSKAPKAKENGIELKLTNDDKDNNLMRLACAATQRNLLEFFVKWGMVPNDETIAYANQWEKETRAIYYVNDEARAYELSGGNKMIDDTKVTATREYGTKNNQVVITLGNSHQSQNKDAILGYEIVRSYMVNDQEKSETIAFVTADGNQDSIKYVDTIDTLNNRVFTYKVTAYDKYLGKTEQLVLDPIKVSHDGTLGSKEDWTIETNLTSDSDKYIEEDQKYKADETEVLQKGVNELINGTHGTDYVGKVPSDKDGEIIISLQNAKRLVGFKYTSLSEKELKNYEVQVSMNGTDWTTVKSVKTDFLQSISSIFKDKFDENHTQTIYFNKENDDKLYMYDAVYVKFIIKDEDISITELDLIGQTGDNVELSSDAIGILDSDVTLGKSDVNNNTVAIPKGSIVFTGTYKGNPAYNVVKLWDQDKKIIEGSQTFYAEPVKKDGELGEVSEGIWIYWIEPTIVVDENGDEILDGRNGKTITNPKYTEFLNKTNKTVRAELYRVDNALTLENERLTSDTYFTKILDKLPTIHLNSNATIE